MVNATAWGIVIFIAVLIGAGIGYLVYRKREKKEMKKYSNIQIIKREVVKKNGKQKSQFGEIIESELGAREGVADFEEGSRGEYDSSAAIERIRSIEQREPIQKTSVVSTPKTRRKTRFVRKKNRRSRN